MYLVRAYSRNSGQRLILTRKDTFLWKEHFLQKRTLFMKKGHQIFHPSYSNLFLSFLDQNKVLYNFRNMECNIGLEYTLPVASNVHISTTLSNSLWKNVNDWKIYVPVVPIIMPFKVLKHLCSGKISSSLLAGKNLVVFSILTHTTVGFFLPGKC